MMEATRAANGTFTNVRRSYTLGAVVVASREMTSNSTGTVSWLLGNHQGSVTVTVTNTVPATRWYSPYGDQRGPTPTVSPTSTGFLGQHEDNNELVYLNNRYHDPTLGNFISVDPLVTTTGQPYTYGNANPINYSDPTGLDPDTSSTIQFQSFGYCVGGDGRCSDASIRRLFTRFHRTNQGRAISATIDVAYQSDWGKLDGNWSSQDIDYAAAGGPALFLHDGNAQAAAIVARVAGALQGHEDVWERLDVDRSWWDRNRGVVISGVILALDVVAVAGAGTCAFTGGGGCGVSALSSVGATELSLDPPNWWGLGCARVHQKGLLSWENVDVRSQLPNQFGRHFLCGQYRAPSTAMTRLSIMTV